MNKWKRTWLVMLVCSALLSLGAVEQTSTEFVHESAMPSEQIVASVLAKAPWFEGRYAPCQSGDCAFIKNADLKSYCRGDCAFIRDSDLKSFCRKDCAFIRDSDAKSYCRKDCAFIRNSDLKSYCRGDCAFIRDADMKSYCRKDCAFIRNSDLKSMCRSGRPWPAPWQAKR